MALRGYVLDMKTATSIELNELSFPPDGDAGLPSPSRAPSATATASFVAMAVLMLIGAILVG